MYDVTTIDYFRYNGCSSSKCYQSITFCPGIDAQCNLCPVVAHITCLDPDERKKAFDNNFICAFCMDDFEYNKTQFLEQRFNQAQKVIKASYTAA